MIDIFEINFERWELNGFWDDRYTPFSYFEDNKIVSSVCIYSLEMVINGERKKVAQISGVGTLPEYRRKGLSQKLTNFALEWAKQEHDSVFLFASDEAVPYYNKCNFNPISEFIETLDIKAVKPSGKITQLNPENTDDLNTIRKYIANRTSVSDKFGVLNDKLTAFHALYLMRNCIFEIPDLNCLVFASQSYEVLEIYDIIGAEIPLFSNLYPYLSSGKDQNVKFYFFTDKLGISNTKLEEYEGENPYTLWAKPFEKVVYPFTARA